MNKMLPLMQREWLQHRNGWLLLLAIPLALAMLALSFGHVEISSDEVQAAGAALPTLMAVAAIGGSTAVLFGIVCFSSLIIVSGLARRDHADRSVEFWLSMPVSHSASLGTPMLVHLVLVPAAALLAGLLGGYVMSFMLVGRMFDTSAWLGLPWATIVPATFSMALRLLAGLPLALLWLSPMILLVVLLTAWFRKWGWVILTVGLGLGSWLMKWLFGHPFFNDVTRDLLIHAARALVNNTGGKLISNNSQAADTLALVPSWALSDFGHALTELATPLFPAALLVAAACFYLLVQWRQRGASATA